MYAASIPIKIQTESLSLFSPLALYEHFKGRMGEKNVYIIESLNGPKTDRRGSLVGFDRLVRS